MLDFLLGSVKDNAKREHANYNFEDGTRKKDLGDYIGDFLTGRGAAIDEAVKQEHIRRLNQKFGGYVDEANEYLGSGSKVPEINENTDPDKLQQELKRAAPKVKDMKAAKAFAAQNGFLLQPSEYNGDAAAMLSDANSRIEEKAENKRLKLRGEQQEETRRLEGREDRLLLLQMDHNNRQSDRQFQLQMAQNDYNNRRLDMQDERAERRDRQAMIMQLMKGLAQMGQGIAI